MDINQSLKRQQELAEYIANQLYKMCEEIDYISKAINDQLDLLSPFREYYEKYILFHNGFKITAINVVSDVIKNHIGYIKAQQDAIGYSININKTRGIPFLKEEMKKILKDMGSNGMKTKKNI